MKKAFSLSLTILLSSWPSGAQTLSLEDCRRMAVENNKELQQEEISKQMAHIDKNIARAHFYPDISIKGMYLHNSDNISLISSEASGKLRNLGDVVPEAVSSIVQKVLSTPGAATEYFDSPLWQAVAGALRDFDIGTNLTALGCSIDDALHFNIADVGGGVASLQQPIFVGGKIIASNKIADLAEELAARRYDEKYRQTIIDVDQAYWQVVSIAAKLQLCEELNGLMGKMTHDADAAVKAGMATNADLLSVKVKANEAAMMLTKATNGLRLSKMLLCKVIGLPLDSNIFLEDEGSEDIAAPTLAPLKTLDEICATRPDIGQLKLAEQIYKKKVSVARADMMPTIAFTANYIYTNPNLNNGFSNTWNGRWNVGVVMNIPIFHGTMAMQRLRKSKLEAQLYASKYADTKEKVSLQVNQLRCQMDEALQCLESSRSNLESAEENLRSAMLGFEAGVIPANTTMAAQTAWFKAHSEYIDAGINLQITAVNINKAEGNTL